MIKLPTEFQERSLFQKGQNVDHPAADALWKCILESIYFYQKCQMADYKVSPALIGRQGCSYLVSLIYCEHLKRFTNTKNK